MTDLPPPEGPAGLLAPALLDWASRTDPAAPRVCLVTGGRGTGKSRLLAWLLAVSDRDPATAVHATVPAQGQTARTMAWEFGRQLGYGPLDPGPLLERLAADPRPVRLLIPDLHLAGRGPADLPAAVPDAAVAELVGPLLALPRVRAAVEVGAEELLRTEGALVLALPTAGPGETGPGATELGVTRPGVTGPGVTRPGVTVSGETGPGVMVRSGQEVPAVLPPPPVDWRRADPQLRASALDRALEQGAAAALLADPGFLVHGSAVAITATLADRRVAAPRRLRAVWNTAGPVLSSGEHSDPARAAVLHAAALGRDPGLAEFLRPLAETHAWTARWHRPDLHATAVTRAGAGAVSGAELIVADPAGRLHRHDQASGALLSRITSDSRQRPSRMTAVAADSLLAVDAAGRLHTVAGGGPSTAPAAIERLVRHHNAATLADPALRVTAVDCALVTADGPTAATAGPTAVADATGGFHLWPTGADSAPPLGHRPHRSPVAAVAVLHRPDGSVPTLVLTGGLDGTVRLWDAHSGQVMPEPVERRNALPTALAVADTPVGAVLAVAWSDRRLHLWRIFEGRLAVVPLLTGTDALALTPDGLLIHAGPAGALALQLDLAALWPDLRD
jgi:hypothetical protein